MDIAGFSRGAALALSFANEIAGKIKDLDIRYIGLWDVVGEFGLPGEHVNAGHNLHMPPNAHNVFHAMARSGRGGMPWVWRMRAIVERPTR